MPPKSLLEQARHNAKLARERAHKMMRGGGTGASEPTQEVQRAIDEAIKKARQMSEATGVSDMRGGAMEEFDSDLIDDNDEIIQDGGSKDMAFLREKAEAKLKAFKDQFPDRHLPTMTTVMNSMRSYKATVNGVPLGTKSYFHGAPRVAAIKVVSIYNKQQKSPVLGIDNALEIELTEVTRGVHTKVTPKNPKPQKFKYAYFGWRVELDQAKTIHVGENGKTFEVKYKNIVVPKHGRSTAQLALKDSESATKKRSDARTKCEPKMASESETEFAKRCGRRAKMVQQTGESDTAFENRKIVKVSRLIKEMGPTRKQTDFDAWKKTWLADKKSKNSDYKLNPKELSEEWEAHKKSVGKK